MSREERLRKMREDSRRSMEAALNLLDDELEALRDKLAQLDAIKPVTTEPDTYAKLIAAVEESTRQNESIAQLKDRIRTLGTDALELAKTLGSAAKNLT